MSTLALLLAAPLQSWGASARFARRTTENAPTKSGVLGLLAAAQGRDRGANLADLAALRFGVRVDQPGRRLRDYHTAQHPDTGVSMPVSERFYLADAVFVAAVEGNAALIAELHEAVRAPVFLPYLGRRSCPPAGRLDIGVFAESGVEQVLQRVEWRAAPRIRRGCRDGTVRLDLLVDTGPSDDPGDTTRDVPLSFDPAHRRHGLRGVTHRTVSVANPDAELIADHDPLQALGDD